MREDNSKKQSWWRVRHLPSETTSHLRENQNEENEICFRMKCVSIAVKICFGKFKWLLLKLMLLESEILPRYQILLIY